MEVVGFKIHGLVRVLDNEVKVYVLIDQDLGTWKRNLIGACFDQLEERPNSNLPFSLRSHEDKIIWHNENNRDYSDKSAYHILGADKLRKGLVPWRTPNQKLWKTIWNAHVHTKIKSFMFILSNNILPIKRNLQRKWGRLDTLCTLCSSFPESA